MFMPCSCCKRETMSRKLIEKEVHEFVSEHRLDETLVEGYVGLIEQVRNQGHHPLGDAPTAVTTLPFAHVATNTHTPALLLQRADEPPRDAEQGLGRYEMLDRIGQGGMGEVFRVRDPELNRKMV